MTLDDTRHGTIYDPVSLAAGSLVHCHPLQSGDYVLLFRSRWTEATRSLDGPQRYSSYTESTAPSWVTVSPATGIAGVVTEIPTRIGGDRALNGACSRVNYIYTVGTVGGQGYVALHSASRDRSLLLRSEELLPVVSGVTFGYGCYLDGNYLVVVGRDDDDDRIYLARRRWGFIGSGEAAEPWYFRGERGWLADADYLSPVTSKAGVPITSVGPVSVIKGRDRTWMSTVAYADNAYTALVYTSRTVDDAWVLDGDPADLGFDGDYRGGGLFFQPQLPANISALPSGSSSGVPYVISTRVRENRGGSVPTFVAEARNGVYSNVASNTIVARPTGTADGDLLVAMALRAFGTGLVSPPAGWTLVETFIPESGYSLASIYTKIAASEEASSSWSWSSQAYGVVSVSAIRNADEVSAHAFSSAAVADAVPSAPALDVETYLLMCYATAYPHAGSATATPPAGMTEVFDFWVGGAHWSSMAILEADRPFTADAERVFTTSVNVGYASYKRIGVSIAIGAIESAVDTSWGLWPTASSRV